ncbi:WD40 repeat [Geosmithia morbida]|uniref:WD40 repeat n=1 Tax=Geosmithia morbida TaxID=1094350 RepID=A0A9P4YXL5_9HYPO|nr:WD40 repeat [Geosmithia morbida]KAF4123654.1 WD40 repeat [Geosmithia morbida]
MAATPSNNRLKLTPSNSPFFARAPKSPLRGRPAQESRLSLKRVVGTTCSSPCGLDTVKNSFAYIAGGAVVVVHVDGQQYSQRFYRARPTAQALYPASTNLNAPSTPSTPKANDSRGRVAPRESPYSGGGGPEWAESPGSRTWTSRERIKAATCLSLSCDGKYLAVGETGYAPRVLIFTLQDSSSDTPLVSISEHTFGVRAVAWSPDSRYLASLGAANDGFLYVWKIDPRTGAAKLFQQNRCTSFVKDMVWQGNVLITLGVRHVKAWKIDETPSISPTKPKFPSEPSAPAPTAQKTLPGRNVVLGALLEATFTCAAVCKQGSILCTETGDVCIFDDDDSHLKLRKVLNLGFPITSIGIQDKVVYVSGKDGHYARLDLAGVMDAVDTSVLSTTQTCQRTVAMGFLGQRLVTIDANHSIDIWSADHMPGNQAEAGAHITLPGHGEAIVGIQPLCKPNPMDAAFLTWSGSGIVAFWDLEGRVRSLVHIPVDTSDQEVELGLVNQLTCARVSRNGKMLVTSDRQGILKVTDMVTSDCLLDIKAHSADCLCISLYEDDESFLMASCGRDRTAQLFHRGTDGTIEHFQTIDFNSKVVQVLVPSGDKVITCSMDRTMQVHDVLKREDDPDAVAAIPSKVITLKASPTSVVMGPDNQTAFVSFLDRSICQFDLSTGRQLCTFKCMDESCTESAVLESLSLGQWPPREMNFLLGCSNTDKSVRLYDAGSGSFLDREWGHTEAVNGVCLIDDGDGNKKAVSVGSDATIMIWTLDLTEQPPRTVSRDPSPAKDLSTGRPTLRRVLSKAELAEFQRSSPSGGRLQASPPRTVRRRTSRLNLTTSSSKAASVALQNNSSPRAGDDTPSRRPPGEPRQYSPPPSPKSRISRQPSLPTIGVSSRKKSPTNLTSGKGTGSGGSGFGARSLNKSTEQTCRTLRAYRKKLNSTEPLSPEVLTELDRELRLTAAALGDRAIRSKAMNETVLSGLLDQYSERLVTLLDQRLKLNYHQPHENGESSSSSPDSQTIRNIDDDSGSSSP